MKRPRITFSRVVWSLSLIVVIGLWVRSRRTADQWLLLKESGASYTFGTHPHGIGLEIATHGRDLVDLWHPHTPPSPSGLSFSSFKWGALRTVTYYGMGSNDSDPGVFTRTEVRHWDAPPGAILGAGFNTNEHIVGPPVPPVPIRSLRTVLSIPFWLILLLLFFPIGLRIRRRWSRRLAAIPRPSRTKIISPQLRGG